MRSNPIGDSYVSCRMFETDYELNAHMKSNSIKPRMYQPKAVEFGYIN